MAFADFTFPMELPWNRCRMGARSLTFNLPLATLAPGRAYRFGGREHAWARFTFRSSSKISEKRSWHGLGNSIQVGYIAMRQKRSLIPALCDQQSLLLSLIVWDFFVSGVLMQNTLTDECKKSISQRPSM
jgi:hypothetical protein